MTEVTVSSTKDKLADLRADLALLDARLSREIRRSQLRNSPPGEDGLDGLDGLCPSDSQIDTTLADYDTDTLTTTAESPPSDSEIALQEASLRSRRAVNLNGQAPARMDTLHRVLQLSEFDVGVLALCLAPELDRTYELLFACLQDDLGKRHPTVELALRVLTDTPEERIERRQSFGPAAPLRKYGLVQLATEPYCQACGSLARSLSLDPRILDYLLGFSTIDDQLRPFAEIWDGKQPWDNLVLPPETKGRLQEYPGHIRRLADLSQPVLLQLVGPAGCGKQTAARAICHSLGRKMLTIDCGELLSCSQDVTGLLHRAHREALILEAVPFFRNSHFLSGKEPRERTLAQGVEGLVAERLDVAIMGGGAPWLPSRTAQGIASLTVEIPPPGYPERKLLWQNSLLDCRASISDGELNLLVGKYRCSGRQIKEAVASAFSRARWRAPDSPVITFADLVESFRYTSSRGQGRQAGKLQSQRSWDDLVLPDDRKHQLLEICDCFRNMPLVYGQWGFDRDSSLGKGLNLLFVGSSGTGKTMAAELVASTLELELHRIDLSDIVSKYVGETEKNLEAMFLEAQDTNRILLFDEADALFGKRAEVRDSHDRYANIEVSYLLQKMEEYQGIAILTTNLRSNMDDAFLRRLHFVVEFPFPAEEQRLHIWRRVFPSQAPLHSDVDLAFMASQFRLAGGNIKNIAVAAAFLAAYDGNGIEMRHLMQATRREYQKMGKLLTEQDFGLYFEPAMA